MALYKSKPFKKILGPGFKIFFDHDGLAEVSGEKEKWLREAIAAGRLRDVAPAKTKKDEKKAQ